jgi:AAA+ ATPase superfamily predicted ATPase
MVEITSNPFTPKSGWEPMVFAGREKEVEFFRKKLAEAKKGRCDHFLVLGDWGIGKTSLMKEFKKIAQKDGVLTSYFPIREFQKTDRFVQATEQLIKEIPRGLPIKYENLKNFIEYLRGLGITLPVIGGGIQIPSKDMGLTGDPQVLLLEGLINIWEDVKKESDVVVVFLDDVQNYSDISGYLTILKNVLSYDEIIDTGFLFVLSSTPDGWMQFQKKHHPIGRYFTPRLKLKRLDKDEVFEILNKTLDNTGVIYEKDIKNKIHEYTGGHPYELQILCSYLYDNQISGRVTENVWEVSLNSTIENMGEILLDALYAETSMRERDMLYSMALEGMEFNWKKAHESVSQRYPDFSENMVGSTLRRLVDKGLLTKPGRGLYAFQDKLFRYYVLYVEGGERGDQN